MLVLTRKRDEAIKIGDEIIIRVIHTGKGRSSWESRLPLTSACYVAN